LKAKKRQDGSLKVVIVHNYYQQAGGEDQVVAAETALLQSHGHQVLSYVVHNNSLNSIWQRLMLLPDCIFSLRHYRRFLAFLAEQQPDLVHVHNYFPLLSPAIFYAAKKAGVPVVHSLHNFRAICPSATLFDGQQVNTRSISQSPFWTVRQKIYRQSYAGTFLLYLMVVLHRWLGTWQQQVDVFIALSESQRQIYRQAGWPLAKMALKPNFILPPELTSVQLTATQPQLAAGACLYVGRLAAEKGLLLLLQAWQHRQSPLYLVGSGPLQPEVQQAAALNPWIRPLGQQSASQVQVLMQQATLLLVPSIGLESFGLVVLEAFWQRLPVLVAGHGALADVVQHGQNGWHFLPGDSKDLLSQADVLLQNSSLRLQLAEAGWQSAQQHYLPEQNYQQLLAIYRQAQTVCRRSAQPCN
jgi:glycosyltransferase involved in cell wall biosynthesis